MKQQLQHNVEIKKLSEEQFIDITLEVNHLMLHNRSISSGLAWFSVLNTNYPKLARAIKGTENDPSTDNKNLDRFYISIKGF